MQCRILRFTKSLTETQSHSISITTPAGPDTSLESRISAHVREVLPAEHLFLVDVSIRGRKGSRVIEVFVDGDEGVGVADLARISRELAFVFDAEDLVKGKYHLNVSTPGENRALLMERQFNRHIGKTIELTFIDEDGPKPVEGENLGVHDGVLKVQPKKLETLEIDFDRVSKANIKLPW